MMRQRGKRRGRRGRKKMIEILTVEETPHVDENLEMMFEESGILTDDSYSIVETMASCNYEPPINELKQKENNSQQNESFPFPLVKIKEEPPDYDSDTDQQPSCALNSLSLPSDLLSTVKKEPPDHFISASPASSEIPNSNQPTSANSAENPALAAGGGGVIDLVALNIKQEKIDELSLREQESLSEKTVENSKNQLASQNNSTISPSTDNCTAPVSGASQGETRKCTESKNDLKENMQQQPAATSDCTVNENHAYLNKNHLEVTIKQEPVDEETPCCKDTKDVSSAENLPVQTASLKHEATPVEDITACSDTAPADVVKETKETKEMHEVIPQKADKAADSENLTSKAISEPSVGKSEDVQENVTQELSGQDNEVPQRSNTCGEENQNSFAESLKFMGPKWKCLECKDLTNSAAREALLCDAEELSFYERILSCSSNKKDSDELVLKHAKVVLHFLEEEKENSFTHGELSPLAEYQADLPLKLRSFESLLQKAFDVRIDNGSYGSSSSNLNNMPHEEQVARLKSSCQVAEQMPVGNFLKGSSHQISSENPLQDDFLPKTSLLNIGTVPECSSDVFIPDKVLSKETLKSIIDSAHTFSTQQGGLSSLSAVSAGAQQITGSSTASYQSSYNFQEPLKDPVVPSISHTVNSASNASLYSGSFPRNSGGSNISETSRVASSWSSAGSFGSHAYPQQNLYHHGENTPETVPSIPALSPPQPTTNSFSDVSTASDSACRQNQPFCADAADRTGGAFVHSQLPLNISSDMLRSILQSSKAVFAPSPSSQNSISTEKNSEMGVEETFTGKGTEISATEAKPGHSEHEHTRDQYSGSFAENDKAATRRATCAEPADFTDDSSDTVLLDDDDVAVGSPYLDGGSSSENTREENLQSDSTYANVDTEGSPVKKKSRYEAIMERKEMEKGTKATKPSHQTVHSISDPHLRKFCERQQQKEKKSIPVIDPLPLEVVEPKKQKGKLAANRVANAVDNSKAESQSKVPSPKRKLPSKSGASVQSGADDMPTDPRLNRRQPQSKNVKFSRDAPDPETSQNSGRSSGRFHKGYRGTFLTEDTSGLHKRPLLPNKNRNEKGKSGTKNLSVEELHAAADTPDIDSMKLSGINESGSHHSAHEANIQRKKINLSDYKLRQNSVQPLQAAPSPTSSSPQDPRLGSLPPSLPQDCRLNQPPPSLPQDCRLNQPPPSLPQDCRLNQPPPSLPQDPRLGLPLSSLSQDPRLCHSATANPVSDATAMYYAVQGAQNAHYSMMSYQYSGMNVIDYNHHPSYPAGISLVSYMPQQQFANPPPYPQGVPLQESRWNLHQQPVLPSISSKFIPPLPREDPSSQQQPPPPPPPPPTTPDGSDVRAVSPCSSKSDTLQSPTSQTVSPVASFPPARTGNQIASVHQNPPVQRPYRSKRDVLLLPGPLQDIVGVKSLNPIEVQMITVSYNVDWLQEQMKNKIPPPLAKRTLPVKPSYSSPKDHFNTYISYVVLENWERIFHEWKGMQYRQIVWLPYHVKEFKTAGDMIDVLCFHTEKRDPDTKKPPHCPVEGMLVILRFILKDGEAAKVFGYVSDVSGSQTKNMVHSCQLRIKVIYRLQVDISQPVSLISICSLKVFLKQVEALKNLEQSPLCGLVLNPSPTHCHRMELSRFRNACNNADAISKEAKKIIESIITADGDPRVTVVETPTATDSLNTLIALIEQMKMASRIAGSGTSTRILVCTRSTKRLEEIGLRLISSSGSDAEQIRPVIIVKPQNISKEKSHKDLHQYILENLISKAVGHLDSQTSQQATQEACSFVLESCDVILALVTYCHDSAIERVIGAAGSAPLSFCILDEAYLCTEPESIIPLLYGIKRFVLFGDPGARPKLLTRAAYENRYNWSLACRLGHLVKKVRKSDTQNRTCERGARHETFHAS